MKISQINITSLDVTPSQMASLNKHQPHLILIFGSLEFFSDSKFFKKMQSSFSGAQVVGCSTAGEISEDGVTLNSCILTAIHFEKSPNFLTAEAKYVMGSDVQLAGRQIGEKLKKDNLKSIFVLSQGVGINGSGLIKGIQDVVGKKQILTGGLAGDYGAFKKTYTLLNGEVSSDSIVAIGFYGENVQFGFGSRGGWEPFGPIRQITKAAENVLFELDGQSALEVYNKYLGEKAKELPAAGLLYPLAILKEDNTSSGVVRTILGIDEKKGSLILAGDIEEGGKVQLMRSTYEGLVGGAKTAAAEACNSANKENNALGILISCVGRRLVMNDDIVEEVDAVKEVFGSHSVITGFYSNGEIAPFEEVGNCKLHNQTMTITYLIENMSSD